MEESKHNLFVELNKEDLIENMDKDININIIFDLGYLVNGICMFL